MAPALFLFFFFHPCLGCRLRPSDDSTDRRPRPTSNHHCCRSGPLTVYATAHMADILIGGEVDGARGEAAQGGAARRETSPVRPHR